jgi:hypothetical protein
VQDETRILSYAGSEFKAVLRHAEAQQFVERCGYLVPQVPVGFNTISMYFKTTDGLQAMVINQDGFEPDGDEQGRELNGASVYICLDRTLDWKRARYLLKALKAFLLEK